MTTSSTPANSPTHDAATTDRVRWIRAGPRTRQGAGPGRDAKRAVAGTAVRTVVITRSLVRRIEWLYTALPTTVRTLATAAPMTVPAMPR